MPFRKLFADIYIERTKNCVCCNNEKEIEEFVYMKTNKDHRSDVCRFCIGEFEHNLANIKNSICKINGTH